jgi:D-xylose transport system ATP-binding protein
MTEVPMSDKKPIVEMQAICKRYGGVQALADACIEIYRGEVHALVGDNAAGKSTLIKILSGAVARDSGTIKFEGREVEVDSPRAAKALGIETVYQDLALADNLDVASNIFLGRELVKRGPLRMFLDIKGMEQEARRLLGRLKINIPSIRQKVRSMSGGQRQSIAIARSVYFNVGTRRTVETTKEEILRMIVSGSADPAPATIRNGRGVAPDAAGPSQQGAAWQGAR